MRYARCILLVLLLVLTPGIRAQDEEANPLLEILALVPDELDTGRDLLPLPLGYADFSRVEVPAGGLDDMWLGPVMRILTAPFLQRHIGVYLEDDLMLNAVGFEFPDIETFLSYGEPPGVIYMFGGSFDVDTIAEVYTAQGYAAEQIEGVTVWRRADGKSDVEVDAANRRPENPFGGDLGRKQPLAVIPGADGLVYLASSSEWERVVRVVETSQGSVPSLADRDDYRTLVEAITDPARYEGLLVQAQFVNPLALPEAAADYTGVTKEAFENMARFSGFAPEWCNYGALPAPTLAVLADRQEGDDQLAMVALFYFDEYSAQLAVDELSMRMQTFAGSLSVREPAPLIEYFDFEVTMDEFYVYTSEATGFSAAVVVFRYPWPGLPEEDEVNPTLPGLLFRGWMRAIYMREFYPIWQVTPADWMYEEFCK